MKQNRTKPIITNLITTVLMFGIFFWARQIGIGFMLGDASAVSDVIGNKTDILPTVIFTTPPVYNLYYGKIQEIFMAGVTGGAAFIIGLVYLARLVDDLDKQYRLETRVKVIMRRINERIRKDNSE